MNYFYLLTKNRLKIQLNQLLYQGKETKKDKGGLYFLIFVLTALYLFVLAITLGLSSLAISLLPKTFEITASEFQLQWISTLLLMLYLIFSTDNLLKNYIDLFKSNEYTLVFSTPIDIKQFLLSKLFEPYILKLIICFIVLIPVLINVVIKLNLTVITTCLLLFYMFLFFSLVILTRSIIFMFIIINKSKKRNNLLFILLTIGSYYVSCLLFLYLIEPFKPFIPNFVVSLIDKISYLFPLHIVENSFFAYFTPFNWMLYSYNDVVTESIQVRTLIFLFGIICLVLGTLYAFFKIAKNIERNKTLQRFFEITNAPRLKTTHSHKEKLRFSEIKSGALLSRNCRLLILKDIKLLQRESKVYWFSSIFTISVAYGTLLLGYYLASKQMQLSMFEGSIGIILCIFGNSIVSTNMLDKYGFDAENVNFHLIKLSPLKSKEIVLGKFILLLLMSVPFWIIFSILTALVFNVNIIATLFVLISTTFAYGMACLFSNIVYPDFFYEDTLKIPTFKARLLSNGIASSFLIIICGILYVVPTFMLGVIIISITSLFIGSILFFLTCDKVENY